MLVSRASVAQPAKGREVSGTVSDVEGKPIANVSVTVAGGGPTTTTAADGSFKLTVAPASLAIEVNADGYTGRQVQLLPAATPLQLQLTLAKPTPPTPAPSETRMVGGVVSDSGHAPVAGATVRVHGTQIQTLTAADGSFTLPGVATGEVVLDVEAAGQPPTTATVSADRAALAIVIGGAPAAAVATSRSIHGKVTDPSSGEPIVGAQVQIAGTTTLVFTDETGTFALDGAPLGPVRLDISAPEHESHVLDVAADQPTVNIALALAKGEQIVIEGRAPVILKSNPSSGASVIDSKELTRVAAATLDDAMQGKLSGANLQSNSGAPGGGAQLRLRGVSTIIGQSSPLYVIDGVIISNVSIPSGANAITGAAAGGSASNQDNPVNRIADLNPNDIETLEVLKGASAAALYGSKAANGVVVITTKRGRNGENHAEVTQRFGIAVVSNTLGSRKFGSLDEVRNTFCNDPAAAACDANPLVQAYQASGGKYYDHEAELTRTAFMRETLGSVSGGTDKGNYYGSVLVSDEPGVVIGTFYQKQSGKLAVGYKFFDKVRLGVTANVIHSVSDRGLTNNDNTGTSNYVVLAGTPSFVNLQPVNGVYPSNPGIGSGANPLQTVNELRNREEVWRLISGATTQIDAYSNADGSSKVKLLANFGADSFTQKNNLLSPNDLTFEPADGLTGTSINASTTNLNWNTGASVLWTFQPQDHSFRSALSGGVTYESVDTDSVYVIAQNLNASQQNVNSGAAQNTTEGRLRTRDSGIYAQEEVAVLDDRLSLLGGLLAERSSLNGDTDKYYVYPKVAAVYSLIGSDRKNEPALLSNFDSLRVRAAYGEAGNRPNYGQKFTPINATTNIDGNAGLVVAGTIGDPNIEPERQREFELGTDIASKDQRIVAEITGYQRNISNLLLQRALATSTGFGTQFLNGGRLRNRGIEAAIQIRPISTKVLEWMTRGTLTLNRSRVSHLPSNVPAFNITTVGFGAGLGAFRIENGKSATQIVLDGANGLEAIGNGEPDFRIGWSNVVTAGDFTFSALVDWQHGSDIVNLTRLLYDTAYPGGNSADVAGAAARQGAADARPYIEDASFVKLREVSITYNLPAHLVSELGPLKTLQVGLSGRNLLTFTNYSGLDPEVSNFGSQPIGRNYDVAPYPPSRSFWLSITAGL
jgi:TonB-linked SusC/RagA family outer membrane protein